MTDGDDATDSSGVNWKTIREFVGFGPADAEYVFVGMEEGLDKDADLIADLRARSNYSPYMDLVAAQTVLGPANRYVGPNAICQKTWRPMAHLMLRLENTPSTTSSRNRYQGERLGRIPGRTLLCELLPYPRTNMKGPDWEYRELGQFNSFGEYRDALLDDRIRLLQHALRAHPRKLIVCYGKGYWPDYERLLSVERWHRCGRFQYGKSGDTAVVMGWHFSGYAFNSDADLDEFYRVVSLALALQ